MVRAMRIGVPEFKPGPSAGGIAAHLYRATTSTSPSTPFTTLKPRS